MKEIKHSFRKEPVPNTGRRPAYCYYRNPKTTQEKRMACDPEIFFYIRACRSMKYLSSSWDDISRNIQRCWKYQKKIKRQWMLHNK